MCESTAASFILVSRRLALSNQLQKIGIWGALALFALRVGIGWHFYKEGSKKFTEKNFSSIGFLQAAKGPMAEMYRASIPDRFGLKRLNLQENSQFWEGYRQQVAADLGFDQKQTEESKKIVARYVERFQGFLDETGEDLDQYRLEVDHFLSSLGQPENSITFVRERLDAKEVELRGKVAPWLKEVDSLNRALEQELNGLATSAQQAHGAVAIPDRAKPSTDVIVKWVVLGVGVLLVLGLFTRFAALIAMCFLLSVIGSQPPWVEGVKLDYFYYQYVEILALLVIIVFAAGRFAGLDYIIHSLLTRRREPN